MISFKKRRIIKRKLIKLIILISVLLGGLLFVYLKEISFQPEWQWPFSSSNLVKPIPEWSLEEEIRENLSPIKQGLRELDLNSEKMIIATFSGDLTVIFSKEKDFDFQVDSLQFILWRAKIEGNVPYFVDLRFDKPVVRI